MRLAAMHDGTAADNQVFSLFSQRNCSLLKSERWRVFLLIATVSSVIAAAFAIVGAWPILPFAGLELAALYVAFRGMDRRSGDYERLTIDGDRLLLESRCLGQVKKYEWNRLWAKVVVEKQNAGLRLALRYHGREIEFGTYLSDEARAAAARELRAYLRNTR
jgi:uncharacterized membrane protein